MPLQCSQTTPQDRIYLRMCREYASSTKCLSRQVGSLIASPDGTVIAMGRNGPPSGIPHCSNVYFCPKCFRRHTLERARVGPDIDGPAPELPSIPFCRECSIQTELVQECPRHLAGDRSLTPCPAVHAEANAILACARTNNSTVGCSLYLYPLGPCKDCMAQIIQAGITRIIQPNIGPYDDLAPWLAKEARNLRVVLYDLEEL